MRSHKQETFELYHCCKNCYISFSILEAGDEITVRRRIFTLKTLSIVTYESITFLLILLVSISFIVCNRLLLLQIDGVYNDKKQIEYSLLQ